MRFSIDIQGDAEKQLDNLAKAEGLTKVDIIRRAIAVYAAIKQNAKGGSKLVILDEDNNAVAQVIVP